MNIILPGQIDNLESRFGNGAKVVNHIHDDKPSPGYLDENKYFHPMGNDDWKKWRDFKKAESRVQEYLNIGVPESYVKAHITRLAKLGFDTETCWARFSHLYEGDKLKFAATKGKEEALMKFSLENPEVKNDEKTLIKDPSMLDKLMNIFKPEKEVYGDCSIDKPLDFTPSNQLMEMKYDKKIKLSGGILFQESDIKSCIQGKLQLHSRKRAIKLTKKQIKEFEDQM